MLKQPKDALNKAYRRQKVDRPDIEKFRANLSHLLNELDEQESEEHLKNDVITFLNDTWYKGFHLINTKGRTDLVIHNDETAKSPAGVLLEVKKPGNKNEMISRDKLNAKALQELLLYYLREKHEQGNGEIKHLVVTNVYEWFIFDSNQFFKLFIQNKKLEKSFKEWSAGHLEGTDTTYFYKEIAAKYIEEVKDQLEYTWFDLREYEKELKKGEDSRRLIALFKILSPVHLLKQSFANDSNSLNKQFYHELLHIIGLEEVKDKGKKVIQRKENDKRNEGSLLENAISMMDEKERLYGLEKPSQFGANKEEQLYNIGLELCISWINRVLFLKLLESQLVSYHKGDQKYRFLDIKTLPDYDALDSLFFGVLARTFEERSEGNQEKFKLVPYLNSSLFEPTHLEQKVLTVQQLYNHKELPLYSQTVLKNESGKRLSGKKDTLAYLFEFLEAYDFSSEGKEEIQEESKSLINASVLGLIFEKINGYKDGSFYTPGFITMYMCRETIRRAVVQKFNEVKGWNYKNFEDLYDPVGENKKESNEIINSLKICDPAVGSGHFLVSALNEIIAIKSELKILQDRSGKTLRDYHIAIENDELIITDEDGDLFQYVSTSPEKQRVQETLFHEKQTIIENCLFGVDINPNSVKICRLRLWIELLKNAYYKNETELETLPNIDINIKCGNSLISRFDLEVDISDALKKSKWDVATYRNAVNNYKNATKKEDKREFERLIDSIKSDFETEINKKDKRLIRANKLKGEVFNLTQQQSMFEMGAKEKKKWQKDLDAKTKSLHKLETELEAIKNNQIYEDAFEWRFEFPEVLDDEGHFMGFDVVIGNPPYIRVQELSYKETDYYKQKYFLAYKRVDISILFIELSKSISNNDGLTTYITSNQFLTTEYGRNARNFIRTKYGVESIIDFGDLPVFEEALTYVSIFIFSNQPTRIFDYIKYSSIDEAKEEYPYKHFKINNVDLNDENWILSSYDGYSILEKLKKHPTLDRFGKSWAGLFTGMDKVLMFDKDEIEELGFEPDMVLPVIRAQNCTKYYCNEATKYVIYPYKTEGDNTILLSEDELRESYPTTYDYLVKHKNELANRGDSRKKLGESNNWYKLTRFGQKRIFKQTKIVSPGEVRDHKFCIDRSNSGFSCARVFAITIEDESIDIEYLLGLLNSNLIKYFLQSIASLKAGGYYSYSSGILNQIPIVSPDGDLSERISKHVLNLLDNKQKNPKYDTTKAENEIDHIVYELYELTEEEIKIVEAT